MMKNSLKQYLNLSFFLFVIILYGTIIFPLFAEQRTFPISFNDSKKESKNSQNTDIGKNIVQTDNQKISTNIDKSNNNKKVTFQWSVVTDENSSNRDQKIAKSQDSFVIPEIMSQQNSQQSAQTEIEKDKDIKPVVYFNAGNQSNHFDPQATPTKNSTDILMVSDVVKKVIYWHPIIKRSINEVNKSEEFINEAKSGYFPSLKAGVQSSFEDNAYSNKNELEHNFVISLTQNIYDFGKTSSKVALAEATFDRDNFSKEQTINKLIYDTATAYVEVVRYQNLVDIALQQVTGFQTINQIAQQRSKLGASAYSDYSQSQVRLASAQSTLHDFTAQYQRWSAVLNTLANQQISQQIPWDFPNGITDSCLLVDVKNLRSPEINIAEAQIKVAKAQLEKAKADHYPTLSVSPTYEYRLDNNYNTYNRNKTRGDFGIFFNVSMQVMEGGGMNARTNEAQYALAAAQYNLDYERTQITQKILEASSQIMSINFSLSAQKDKVASAIRTRDLYKRQYAELGNRQFSDLINAEAEIHQTKMEIINNQYNIQKLSIECLSNSGTLIANLVDK